jgi:hypothetical protein
MRSIVGNGFHKKRGIKKLFKKEIFNLKMFLSGTEKISLWPSGNYLSQLKLVTK